MLRQVVTLAWLLMMAFAPMDAHAQSATPTVQSVQRWEYKTIQIGGTGGWLFGFTTQEEDGVRVNLESNWMQVRGSQGWELVSLVRWTYGNMQYWSFIFKRPVVVAPAAATTATTDWVAQVRGYLDRAQSQSGENLPVASGTNDEITPVQPGADHRWTINLSAGVAYRLLGACDSDCSNLDIELLDPRTGSVVAADTSPNDFPVVNFTPPQDGAYTVRMIMQTCTTAPCYAGVRTLARTRGQ